MGKLVFLLCLPLSACGGGQQSGAMVLDTKTDTEEIVATAVATNNVTWGDEDQLPISRLNDFGLRWIRTLMPADANLMQNYVVSPLSACYAIGMLTEGADAETLSEMEQALGMKRQEAGHILHKIAIDALSADTITRMVSANLLAVDQRLNVLESYQDSLQNKYLAAAKQVDFASPKTKELLDDWCRQHTHGLIPETPLEPDETTVAALFNAIYFKGQWDCEFDHTENDRFINADGNGVEMPMMIRKSNYRYVKRPHYAMLQMNYRGDYAMLVVLPDEGGTTRQVLNGMTATQWLKDWHEMDYTNVYLGLPRFKTDNKFDLKKSFQQLGIRKAFAPLHANFSRIVEDKPLYISRAAQKARIEVDEHGTEAAVVTQTDMAIGAFCVDDPEPELYTDFYANRPFIYAIVHTKTGAIVFMGEYRGDEKAKPTSTQRFVPGQHQRDYERQHREWAQRNAERLQQEEAEQANYAEGAAGKVYDVVERMPLFPGGDKAMTAYLKDNLQYPEQARKEGREGRVIITFVVEPDGTLSNAKVIKSVSPDLDMEAIRLVKAMPKWRPGRKQGLAVRVKYTIPVTFRL